MVLNTVATLGILSTGGKTALVVYLVSLVWLNITGKHAIRNSLALTIFLLFLYFIGAFDIVLERFGAEDLSSGRNDSTVEVFSQELPRFFKGYGENYMAHMTATIDYGVVAMFSEYSLLALSYKFGIVFVILMIVLLLRRSFIVAREKSKPSIVFMSVMMVLYFSTFNGMVGVPDVYLIMALYIVVLPLYTTMGNDDKSILRKTRHSRNDYPTSCTDYA